MWLVALEKLGLKGGALRWRWVSCPGKVLAGAVEAAPARVLPGEPTLPTCLFVSLSWRCFDHLLALTPPFALLSVAVGEALTARAQIRGTKERPYFSTPT